MGGYHHAACACRACADARRAPLATAIELGPLVSMLGGREVEEHRTTALLLVELLTRAPGRAAELVRAGGVRPLLRVATTPNEDEEAKLAALRCLGMLATTGVCVWVGDGRFLLVPRLCACLFCYYMYVCGVVSGCFGVVCVRAVWCARLLSAVVVVVCAWPCVRVCGQ